MSEQLEDEITSINAIYSDATLTRLPGSDTTYSLLLPGDQHISLRLEFPADYPDAPPAIIGTQSIGDDVRKGGGQQVVELTRDLLADIYVPGSPCIFDLVEEVTSKLEQLCSSGRESKDGSGSFAQQDAPIDGQRMTTSALSQSSDDDQSMPILDHEPLWIISDTITEKKSVFVARASSVTSTDQAKSYLNHLLMSDKKVAKATHNITAWRIQGPGDSAFQDCDDDGETAAGSRLLHLLQLMDVWNVMVVVTRWYGGVHLGPDRFRIINTVARDAVVKGDFQSQPNSGKLDGKRKKK